MIKKTSIKMSEAFVLPELYINPEFSWGPPPEEMLLDGEEFQLYRKPDRFDRNDKPLLPVFDFYTADLTEDKEVKKGGFQEVEDQRMIRALAATKSKRNNAQRNLYNSGWKFTARSGERRRPNRVIRILPNTCSFPIDANVLGQFTPADLSKLPEVVPVVQDLALFALPPVYDTAKEASISKKALNIESVDFRDPFVERPDTLSDRAFRELLKEEDPQIPVIAITDEVLSLFFTANRSVNPWHVKVMRAGSRFIVTRSNSSGNVAMQWVSETAHTEFAPSEDSQEATERISSLGEESTKVYEGFIKTMCTKRRANLQTKTNPFPQTQLRMYRYRRFTVDQGTNQQYNVIVRCEVDAVSPKNEYMRLFGLLEQDKTGREPWKKRIEQKSSTSILLDEFQNNSSKISRWIALSLLSDVSMMKIGFISRTATSSSPFGGDATTDSKKHELQAIESIPPGNLAKQLNVNYIGMWATADLIFRTIMSMGDEVCMVVKTNERNVVIVEADDDDEDSEESEEEEEDEESD